MTTQNSTAQSDVWQLQGTQALLRTPPLQADLDLLKPQLGLSQLLYQSSATNGFVLGVTPGSRVPLPESELDDVFVRGCDLVVTYAETKQRPFSLQIYWRATLGTQGTLMLDTILSLQTELLESFPGVAVTTELPAASAWLLSNGQTPASEISLPEQQQRNLNTDDSDALLLRSRGDQWSYAEMTHPEDRGEVGIEYETNKRFSVQRQLGGRFLEKGVIRRLRVRGVFLTKKNDFALATESLGQLAMEQPPLTV